MASRRDVSESTSRSTRLLGRGRAVALSSFHRGYSKFEQSRPVRDVETVALLPWLLFDIRRVEAFGYVVLVQHGGLGPAQQMPQVQEVLGDVRQLGGA